MAGWLKEYGNPDPVEIRHFMMSSDYDGDLPDETQCAVGSDLTVVTEATHVETDWKTFDGTNWNS